MVDIAAFRSSRNAVVSARLWKCAGSCKSKRGMFLDYGADKFHWFRTQHNLIEHQRDVDRQWRHERALRRGRWPARNEFPVQLMDSFRALAHTPRSMSIS